MRSAVYLSALSALFATMAYAQGPQGTWQGEIDVPSQGLFDERYVFRVNRGAYGDWSVGVVIDEDWGMIWHAHEVSVDGGRIKFTVPSIGSTYDGTLDQDGESMTGVWSVGPSTYALRLVRPTASTLWRETPHRTLFVTVQKNVRLEVLDWGGTGRSLVLLAGASDTAHVFSRLAARLRLHYHVYGITRRGFGASSAPAIPVVPESSVTMFGPENFEIRPFRDNPYDANRLGDDVVQVLNSLHIVRPVLLGHSIAGEELSSVATRYPDRIAGLIYIDALQEYAFSDGKSTDALFTFQHPMRCQPGIFLTVACPLAATTDPRHASEGEALMLGMHIYKHLPPVPALAIFALPQHRPANVKTVAEIATFNAFEQRQLARIRRITALLPTFHIEVIPYASHEIWESHEAKVLHDINAFIGGLSRS